MTKTKQTISSLTKGTSMKLQLPVLRYAPTPSPPPPPLHVHPFHLPPTPTLDPSIPTASWGFIREDCYRWGEDSVGQDLAVAEALSGVQCRHLCQASAECGYWTYLAPLAFVVWVGHVWRNRVVCKGRQPCCLGLDTCCEQG